VSHIYKIKFINYVINCTNINAGSIFISIPFNNTKNSPPIIGLIINLKMVIFIRVFLLIPLSFSSFFYYFSLKVAPSTIKVRGGLTYPII